MKDYYNRKEAVMFWAVLNDETPLIQSSEIVNSLLSSDCAGIQNTQFPFPWSNKLFNRTSYFSRIAADGIPKEGYTSNYVIKDGFKKTDRDKEIWYNGIDWMILYNFYRIAGARNSTWEPSAFNNKTISGQRYTYRNTFCPCQSSMSFYKDRNIVGNADKIAPHSRERIHSFNEHITSLPLSANPSTGRLGLGELKVFYPEYEPLGLARQ
jgi:hypothetical protein